MKTTSSNPLQKFIDEIKDMSDKQLMNDAFGHGLLFCESAYDVFRMSIPIEHELRHRNLSDTQYLHDRGIAWTILGNDSIVPP